MIGLLATVTRIVTWVKVEKPTFDLVGVILSALGATGLLALGALLLGVLLGLGFIRRRRTHALRPFADDVSLRLSLPR